MVKDNNMIKFKLTSREFYAIYTVTTFLSFDDGFDVSEDSIRFLQEKNEDLFESLYSYVDNVPGDAIVEVEFSKNELLLTYIIYSFLLNVHKKEFQVSLGCEYEFGLQIANKLKKIISEIE